MHCLWTPWDNSEALEKPRQKVETEFDHASNFFLEILKIMKKDQLTIYHIKSHLQKYRLTPPLDEEEPEKVGSDERPEVGDREGFFSEKGS